MARSPCAHDRRVSSPIGPGIARTVPGTTRRRSPHRFGTPQVRCRGGNTKFRAMRLDTGNFSWGSEVCTRKTRVLDVVYNASNNELVRTKTLVKNAIVQIDATCAHRSRAAAASPPRSTRPPPASCACVPSG